MDTERRSRSRLEVTPGKRFTSQEFDQLIEEFNAMRERLHKERIEAALHFNSQFTLKKVNEPTVDAVNPIIKKD